MARTWGKDKLFYEIKFLGVKSKLGFLFVYLTQTKFKNWTSSLSAHHKPSGLPYSCPKNVVTTSYVYNSDNIIHSDGYHIFGSIAVHYFKI